MLIIAIPKSASTSLLMTLKKYHKIDATQTFYKDFPKPTNTKFIHQLHSDIRTLTDEQVALFQDPNHFYKQHIFPSKENLDLFSDVKKVILLRDPIDILGAYRRGAKKGVHNLIPGFDQNWNKEQWLQKAKEVGLWDDLVNFSTKWKENSNKENTLFINYSEYVDDPTATLNKVEKFFGLPITEEKVETVKAKYSRETPISKSVAAIKSIPKKTEKKLYSIYKRIKKK